MSDRRETIRVVHDVASPWDANRARWQQLLNGQQIPARRAQVNAATAIPVTVRLDWEYDGIEYRDTVAWGWTTRAVLIELIDPRRQTIGAWLPTGDVRRRHRQPHTQGRELTRLSVSPRYSPKHDLHHRLGQPTLRPTT